MQGLFIFVAIFDLNVLEFILTPKPCLGTYKALLETQLGNTCFWLLTSMVVALVEQTRIGPIMERVKKILLHWKHFNLYKHTCLIERHFLTNNMQFLRITKLPKEICIKYVEYMPTQFFKSHYAPP